MGHKTFVFLYLKDVKILIKCLEGTCRYNLYLSSFQQYVYGFPLCLIVSELNSTERNQKVPISKIVFRSTWPSLGVCRPLTFHILIFSSETPQPNELKLGRKHLLLISSRSINKHGCHSQFLFLFLIGRFLKIFSSETALPNKPKLVKKHLWKVL